MDWMQARPQMIAPSPIASGNVDFHRAGLSPGRDEEASIDASTLRRTAKRGATLIGYIAPTATLT
jgi:hypothetical protein